MNDPFDLPWVPVYRGPHERCRERAFVLEALGIHSRLAREGSFSVLLTRAGDARRAGQQLRRYEEESSRWPPRPPPVRKPVAEGLVSGLVYSCVLASVFALQRHDAFSLDWWTSGRTEAALIRSGQWWRAVTALTLHVDLSHLFGNMFFGALFGAFVCQLVGDGLGWLTILLSGVLGNLLNAMLQPPEHTSVGASIAVFGAVGIFTAYQWCLRHKLGERAWRRWTPIVVGLVLLSYLGGSGERTDVMGHCCGMGAGLVLGSLHGLFHDRIPVSSKRLQSVLGYLTVAIVPLAWIVAFVA